jgi:hypothetical protein
MVKLKRCFEDDGITSIPASAFPQTAVMYYGLKPEANLREYLFYFSVYNKDRTPSTIIKNKERPDKIFKSTSRHSLELDMQNSNFITNKDFGAINKYRNDDTHAFIGYLLEPNYGIDKDAWDYANVYLDVHNNIILDWRH